MFTHPVGTCSLSLAWPCSRARRRVTRVKDKDDDNEEEAADDDVEEGRESEDEETLDGRN